MHPRSITVDLLSDTTFYQGGGTPGVVDIEIQHDELGLPYLSGKTVRGLILDSWLSLCGYFPELEQAAKRIFGSPGEMFPTSILRIGDAVVASNVREWVTWAERGQPHYARTSYRFTDVRFQISQDRDTGVPKKGTLRATRVIIRGVRLESPLIWLEEPTQDELRCLALGVLACRHAGLGSNRGRGWVSLSLNGDIEWTRQCARGGWLTP